jgi:hypothetical protein
MLLLKGDGHVSMLIIDPYRMVSYACCLLCCNDDRRYPFLEAVLAEK